jgi:Flp pilus assembly pilin Flp
MIVFQRLECRSCSNLPSKPSLRLVTRFQRDEAGSNAVEFAIVAPILLMILLSSTLLGLYIGAAHSTGQLAADAGRYAMVGRDRQEREIMAEAWLARTAGEYPLLRSDRLAMTVRESGELMVVSIEYDMSFLPIPELTVGLGHLPRSIQRVATVLIP